MNDYHKYVLAGKFEEMWQECDDPWNASKEDYMASACSMATAEIIYQTKPFSVVSIGCGAGHHLNWLSCQAYGPRYCGFDISETAVRKANSQFPGLDIATMSIDEFLSKTWDLHCVLLREVIWYMLPDWHLCCDILSAYTGVMVIVELSFYDNQQYGLDYFNGPDDFVAKWPFTIEKIVREHTTKHQREGRLMIAGRIP